jgi:hypothetical protein
MKAARQKDGTYHLYRLKKKMDEVNHFVCCQCEEYVYNSAILLDFSKMYILGFVKSML